MPRFLIDINTQVKMEDPKIAKAILQSVINNQGTPDNIFILDFEQPEKTGIKNTYNIRIPADIKIEGELNEVKVINLLNSFWNHHLINILGIDILGEIEDYD